MICSSFCRNLCFRQEASRSRAVRTWGRRVPPPTGSGVGEEGPVPSGQSPPPQLELFPPWRLSAPLPPWGPWARGRSRSPSPGTPPRPASPPPLRSLLPRARGQPLPRAAGLDLPSPSSPSPPNPQHPHPHTRTSLVRVSRSSLPSAASLLGPPLLPRRSTAPGGAHHSLLPDHPLPGVRACVRVRVRLIPVPGGRPAPALLGVPPSPLAAPPQSPLPAPSLPCHLRVSQGPRARCRGPLLPLHPLSAALGELMQAQGFQGPVLVHRFVFPAIIHHQVHPSMFPAS